jgi:prepilin-type N-terminal cleavage/methylation domain-containing protein
MNRRNRNKGFTLIEMLIVIAIFGIVLAGTSQMLVSMLTVHRQQSRIAETNVEGIIGLELLRQDLGKAGYGLPWNGLGAINYQEAASGTAATLNDASSNPPRGIVSSDGGGWNGTDHLAIKAANVATNSACSKWALISPGASQPTPWSTATPASDNFAVGSTERVIILTPGSLSTESTARNLITSGSFFFAQAGSASTLATTLTSTAIAYGIDDSHDLRMPFNRADYYVSQTGGMPERCAKGTGVLYKGVVNQSNGNLNPLPLLDCVADMQVVFRFDPNNSGSPALSVTSDIVTDTTRWTGAQAIHDQVKEVRVYILAHEGQRDVNYNFTFSATTHCPANQLYVGGDSTAGYSSGRCFDFSGITNWQNYRWKIYSLVVKLDNLL